MGHMQITKKQCVIAGVALLAVLAAFGAWLYLRPAPLPENPLTLEAGDTVSVWDFASPIANNPELVAKAKAEIQRLRGLIGSGTYPDVDIYVGIAGQYDLLGDGKQEYDYLGRATLSAGDTSGLPWHNLGVLMERLGALETARAAYEKSTLLQPLKFYYYSYLEFLTTRMKDDAAVIEKAFVTAKANIGTDADLMQLYSAWKRP
jgi:hypothetical protein